MFLVLGVVSVFVLSVPPSAEAKGCPTIEVNNEVYVVGAEGLRCPLARRYAKRYLRHRIEPKGWKCNSGACSDRSSDAFFIWYRPVDRLAPAAATDARLAGAFKVTAYDREGPAYRIYSFRPLCGVGVCREVVLRRESSDNMHFKSTLKRKRAGVYRGAEHQKGRCRDGDRWRARVRLVVKVTREANGRAQAIRGSAKLKAEGCEPDDSRWRFYGTLR